MKNKLIDLNNHLFAQLERVGQEGITHDDLLKEAERSKMMIGISKEIISNARLALDAQIAIGDDLIRVAPEMIEALPENKPKMGSDK